VMHLEPSPYPRWCGSQLLLLTSVGQMLTTNGPMSYTRTRLSPIVPCCRFDLD
jgi:hypothetical protein